MPGVYSRIAFKMKLPRTLGLILPALALAFAHPALATGESLFVSGNFVPEIQNFDPAGTFVNESVKAIPFYNSQYFGQGMVIANVEGGYIWDGHEVFDRSGFGLGSAVTQYVAEPGLGEFDYHATMVGHVLAGTGYVETGNGPGFSYVGIGMAPFAELWSGAIATSFDTENPGSFQTTTASILTPYKAFFNGITVGDTVKKADVINSSWGGEGISNELIGIDALAKKNPTVAFVVAVGNTGSNALEPATGYNNISVGSLGGTGLKTPSEFSSDSPGAFYNPDTGVTTLNARAIVDISAPGEEMFLAAYIGETGGLQASGTTPSPTDRYFYNAAGTSFAAPTVAGGIALLKEVARDIYSGTTLANAEDTRVIKSVLMAGSARTEGWNNHQEDDNGVLRTTQAVDYAAGAGKIDLFGSAEPYIINGSTRDLPGSVGGTINHDGWDFGTVARDGFNDYVMPIPFEGEIELTISLNWFVDRSLDEENNIGSELSFADLNLQLWQLADGAFQTLVAESATLYDNTEFLRVLLPMDGQYGIRVTFYGMVYDMTENGVDSETYGLAWRSVPEPATGFLIVISLPLFLRRRRAERNCF